MQDSAPTDRRLLAIFLIVLIDVLGLTIILPLLPFYSEHFGASPFVVGLLVSSYAICQLISGPLLGAWSDRIGRKPVLILSQLGTFAGLLILAAAGSLFWVFVARIIDGLTAGNLSTAQAYISDIASPKDRAKSFGKIGMAFGIGFFVGPALTAFLYKYGYQAPILAAAALSFLSVVASATLLPKTSRHERPPATGRLSLAHNLRKYFAQPDLRALLIEIFLFYFSFSAYMAGFALFSERRFQYHGEPLNARQIGYAFAYFGLLQILVQGFAIGRLVRRLGERRLALAGFASLAVGYALMSVIHNPFWIGLTGLFTSLGGGVVRPSLTSEISGAVGPHERGTVLGVNQSLQSVAQILAPLLSTWLIQSAFLPAWGFFPALISLAGAALMAAHLRGRFHRQGTIGYGTSS